MSIKTKITTIIALAVLLTIGTTTAILIRMQNNKLIDAKFHDMEFLSGIIERTIESSAMEGNAHEVRKILENIGKNKEIVNLRLLSADGIILQSTEPGEIGSRPADFVKSHISPAQRPTLLDGTTINYFREIKNGAECRQCHDRHNAVIGFIQIRQDVSESVTTFLSLTRLMIFAGISVVILISLIISFVFTSVVMNPLNNLLSTINNIEAGNWQATATISSNDELGVIGSSFNKMIHKISSLYDKNIARERELSGIRVELEHKTKVEGLNAQLESKVNELQTANKAITSLSKEVKSKNIELERAVEKLKKINEVGRMLSSIIETQELMRLIIQTTADLLNAERVTLHLRSSHKPALTIQYLRGGGLKNITDFSFELNPEFKDLFTEGRPIVVHGLTSPEPQGLPSGAQKIAVPLKMKGLVIGAMILENSRYLTTFTGEELELLTTLSNQAMVAIENAWLYESVKTNYFATIQSLVNALEASDRFTKGHSERVRFLSVELGKFIGLDFREIELLEHAAILHDIGKIGIDNFILQKQGKLTSKEYSLIKTHPLIGDDILGPIDTLEGVRKTIIQHHERYDGNGYPYGLRGDEISLKAKILSVVDTFDAMMTDRPYRKALSLQAIKDELKSNSGTQFDPYVAGAFVDMLDQSSNRLLAAYAGYDAAFSAG